MGKKIADKGSSEKFLREHVAYNDGRCLQWPFRLNDKGYGFAVVSGKQRSAHNWMCRLAHGEPPKGKKHAAHSCGNRSCVNPRHLRWASHAENSADRYEHGTIIYGEKSGKTNLTARDVVAIRKSNNGLAFLADRYGVSKGCISKIRCRQRWPHV